MATKTMSAEDIEKYLADAPFPCDKQTLINYAKSKNVPKEVIDALNGLPNREYISLADVSEEMEM